MFRTINAETPGPMNFGIGAHGTAGLADTSADKNLTMH